jgi:methionyl-tRNA formyltransferase
VVQAGIDRTLLSPLVDAWRDMLANYKKRFPDYPDTEILEVENINSDEAFDFTNKLQPDLVIVSGTRLVRKQLLSVPAKIGILNLHTGLSPYVKGGPNCTNWCIATGDFHLIGNTIMWIDAGIDSGNILTTEFTELDGSENLSQVHLKVMEHAHDLYIRSIEFLSQGKTQTVPQNTIDPGKTYYNKEWTLRRKIKVVTNLRKMQAEIRSGKTAGKRKNITAVKL